MNFDIQNLLADFKQVARLAGVTITERDITIEKLLAPHIPPNNLPAGKMAVYVFTYNYKCLKVGKVGPRSKARYTSQHYNPKSSQSNLAKSILKSKKDFGSYELTEITVGDWIKRNTDRLNFLVNAALGVPVLTLLESYLQCRLRPRFEGFASQR